MAVHGVPDTTFFPSSDQISADVGVAGVNGLSGRGGAAVAKLEMGHSERITTMQEVG
jgi:hypothetical protein